MGQLPPGFQAAARRRRSLVVLLSAISLIVLSYLALYTVVGQNIDNLTMEAVAASARWLHLRLGAVSAAVSIPALGAISIGVVAVAIARRRAALAWRALLVVGGANATAQLLKEILPRPELGVGIQLENSYPSGHVTYAAAIAVALIMVAPRGFRSPAALVGWLWTTLMGLMVISQGWHRLADVVGALLIVALWGFASAPAELRPRVQPGLTRAGTYLAAATSAIGIILFVVSVIIIIPEVFAPLSYGEIGEMVEVGTREGVLFSLATLLLLGGLGGLLLNGIDRLSEAR